MSSSLSRVGEGLLPERSVSVKEARGTKTTHAWQLQTMTDKGRLLTVQITHCSWLSSLQVSPCIIDTHISARNSPHNSSVKFSESVCVPLVASLTEEMTAQSIAYHAHGTADGGKSCCYPWLVCHDIKSAMHCALRLAPTMINHLTSICNWGEPERAPH